MDNKELNDLLKSRFSSLQAPPEGPSLVPAVMARLASESERTAVSGARHDWVLVFAALLGALVCLPSLQGADLQSMVELLTPQVLGAYSQTIAALSLPLLVLAALLPLLWGVLEE